MTLKANIHSIIINYTCPNCRLTFQLNNIPKESFKYECDSCWESILIEPVIKNKPAKNTKILKVRKALRNLGWDKDEVEEMLNITDHKNKTVEELIKLALSTKV